MTKPMTDEELRTIESAIQRGTPTRAQLFALIAEVRRLRAVLDVVDASTQRIEAGVDRLADQSAELATAVDYLDHILLAYTKPGIMPLMRACRQAQAWRGFDSQAEQV